MVVVVVEVVGGGGKAVCSSGACGSSAPPSPKVGGSLASGCTSREVMLWCGAMPGRFLARSLGGSDSTPPLEERTEEGCCHSLQTSRLAGCVGFSTLGLSMLSVSMLSFSMVGLSTLGLSMLGFSTLGL